MRNSLRRISMKLRGIFGADDCARRRGKDAWQGVESCESRLLLSSQWEGVWDLTLTSPLPPPADDPGPYQMTINPEGLSTVSAPGNGSVRLTKLRFSKNDETMTAKIKTGEFKGKVRGVMLPAPTIPEFHLHVEILKPLDQLYDFDGHKAK